MSSRHLKGSPERLPSTPDDAFGEGAWARLPEAVRFRNLLVHEATYLNGGTCDALFGAATHILDRLGQLAGVRSEE